MNHTEIFNKFVQREVENSDDKYKLTVNETKEVFKNAIQAVEELTQTKIDPERFNEFLTYYKVMKIVEAISEEVRSDKYVADMRERLEKTKGTKHE